MPRPLNSANRILGSLRRNKLIALATVVGIIVIGLGNFTKALTELGNFFGIHLNSSPPTTPSEKTVELDPRRVNEIGPFQPGTYHTLAIVGQWQTGFQQPFVGPRGSATETLGRYPKWAVILQYINPTNDQVLTEAVYPGQPVNLFPNLKLRLFVNDEPQWMWDNTNDQNDPLRVILKK
jgi:hypothetical protein